MSQTPENPDALRADLLKWVHQNEDVALDWFLDEGPVQVPAQPQVPVEAEADKTPAPSESTKTQPTPEASAVPLQPAPEIADPVFRQQCENFVTETLKLVQQQPAWESGNDPLLAAHAGDRSKALNALQAEVMPCRLCSLAETRTQVVFGAGSEQARVLFIGEAPGRDEDLQGQPFVGASGQLLTKIIGAIGFDRRHVFICNILKCRPPQNRDPLPEEVKVCEPFLKRQLDIIRPTVICCLGRVAAQTLLGTEMSLGKLRETVHFYQGVPVMATYHPAALLRNPSWKRDTWNDVQRLRALHDALTNL